MAPRRSVDAQGPYRPSLRRGQRSELLDPLLIGLAEGVVRIVLERGLLPTGVDAVIHVLTTAPAAQLRHMAVGDAGPAEPGRHRLAIELRVTPRSRLRAHV